MSIDYAKLRAEVHERLAVKQQSTPAPAPVGLAELRREIAATIAAAPGAEVGPQPAEAPTPAAAAAEVNMWRPLVPLAEANERMRTVGLPPLPPNTEETTAIGWFHSDDAPINHTARIPWRQSKPF
jgi:hypothetical protein